MQEHKSISQRIIERFRERTSVNYVNEIIVVLKGNTKQIKRIKIAAQIVEGSNWRQYDNDHLIRLDNRLQQFGGPQLHIKNRHTDKQWAYLGDGRRSEPNKYTSPSTRAIQNIVRDRFNLDKSIQIESSFIGFSNDKKALVLEAFIG